VFPYNISATAGASDFKFGMQFGFANAYHKMTPIGKSGGGLGLGELPKIWGFPFNIYAMAKRIRCATVVELRLQLIGDFYEK